MRIIGIAHVGIAAENADAMVDFFTSLLCGTPLEKQNVPAQCMTSTQIQYEKGRLEIMETTAPDGVIGKFISKRGQGLHHISFQVEGLSELIEMLESKGVRVVGKRLNVPGKNNVAFIDPRSAYGVLIELVEPAKQ
jgi:methylmalonyl-CoA epimerase